MRGTGPNDGHEINRISTGSNAKSGWIIDHPDQRRREIPDAVDGQEAQYDKKSDHGRKYRRLTRDRNFALLDGIANLLFRRLFGFALLVGCLGHNSGSLGKHLLILLLRIELDFPAPGHFQCQIGNRPSRIEDFALVRRNAGRKLVLDQSACPRSQR